MLERSISILDPLGRISLIVPLSLISAERMRTALTLLSATGSFTSLLALSGDAHPCVLFDGVKMSFTVMSHAAGRQGKPRVFVSKLYRWLAAERDSLFPCAEYMENPVTWVQGLPTKMSSDLGASLFRKLTAKSEKLGQFVVPRSRHKLLYHRIVRHFVKSFTKVPYFWNERDGKKRSEDYKELFFDSSEVVGLAHALLISSTYYLFFIALSDSYHCGRELILSFPVELSSMSQRHRNELLKLGLAHQDDLFKHSRRRRIKYKSTGWIEYDEFYPRESKRFIDKIDKILAEHYGFSDEELDFITNYDIKYRMGQDEAEEGE
jgi:hypothetical protein